MATKDRATQLNITSQQFEQSRKSGARNDWDLLPDAIYWPFKRLPAARLLLCANACVEIVLKHCQAAERLYSAIVEAWGLPGCQPLINEARRHLPDTRMWFAEVGEAIARNQAIPNYPKAWEDALLKLKLDLEHNHDYHTLLQGIGRLIVIGFNHKSDLENLKPKVLPKNSLYLFQIVHDRSLFEFGLQAKQRERDSRQPIVNGESLYELGSRLFNFAVLMGTKHTTRRERRAKHSIVEALRQAGFTLHHDSKLLDNAEKWYRSRVNPGTIEAYVDELAKDDIYIERSNIETAIAPYDEATGYPRKWRK